jgi:hypothetical protein
MNWILSFGYEFIKHLDILFVLIFLELLVFWLSILCLFDLEVPDNLGQVAMMLQLGSLTNIDDLLQ